jgi:hypothetical protein
MDIKTCGTSRGFIWSLSQKDFSHKHAIKWKLYNISRYNFRSWFVCKCQTNGPKEDCYGANNRRSGCNASRYKQPLTLWTRHKSTISINVTSVSNSTSQTKHKVTFYFKINIDCYISSFLLQGKTEQRKHLVDMSNR